MTNERLMQLIREAHKKNLTTLDLSGNQLTQLSPKIKELKSLIELDLSENQLTQFPPEITELKNLTTLNLSGNQLTQFPIEIIELKNLTTLNLSGNQLTQFPIEIIELKNLTTLNLSENQLTQLPPEIGELKNLITLQLYENQITELPPEIIGLKNLIQLNLSGNKLTQLPPEISQLKNLSTFSIARNQLTQLPLEITKLKNLKKLFLFGNYLKHLPLEITKLVSLETFSFSCDQLTQFLPEITGLKNLNVLSLSVLEMTELPPEISKLKNLTELYLHWGQLTKLPPEIAELKNLTILSLYKNQITQLPLEITELKNLRVLNLSKNNITKLPSEITELKNLTTLNLSGNPLTSPPQEIASMGVEAIFTYLKQPKTTENNEAKLILVGNGEVGKTCLANRLITDKFEEDRITEGINISEWITYAPDSRNSKIKLNIWDFGGQEIYHATHQFFLTERSVYLLVWNARKTKDYDNIYYWLHTIEAFGEDSQIILVMSKMNEIDDDLNLKDLKSKFPQIAGYLKIDSKDGKGISVLKEKIRETAWSLPSMRVPWVDSWYKVREKLEGLGEYWITYNEFCNICVSEGLDNKIISILDGYLHQLGVILHFKDKIGLKNIVILKPEWATDAFYKILSTKSVFHRGGVLLPNELDQIWNTETYPSSIHLQLMELMNKFELAYELPDKTSYLIPELLPKSTPDYDWHDKENLYFYYCYDSFLPPGIITRLIVRMHQDIEKKENGMPLCWREGIVLRLQNSRALVKMKPDEKQIEIRIKGNNKRGALGAICDQLDQINNSIKKINVSKQIPCNYSEYCPQRYFYEDLLEAEKANVKNVQCHKTYRERSISLLLDGYKRREERFREPNEFFDKPVYNIINQLQAHSESNSCAKAEQKTDVDIDVNVNVNINLKINLPIIQTEFDDLKNELESLNPKLDSDLEKIQDTLDEISTGSDKKDLAKPFNKLRRFLDKLGDENSEYNKLIKGTEKGIECAQKLGRTYNKFAQWLAMPQVPDLFLGR